jgi:hypothetical protein
MLYQLSYPRTQLGFYPAQDWTAFGISTVTSLRGAPTRRPGGDARRL